jgi:hypothetical protein
VGPEPALTSRTKSGYFYFLQIIKAFIVNMILGIKVLAFIYNPAKFKS